MITNDNSDIPQVSIVLATYNRAGLLPKAIASVLAQTFQSWELIIVDDGSTDTTDKVVAEYRDPRITYLKVEHGERSRARNIGVEASNGQYLAFLDSDDWYLPNKLSVQAAALENNPECGLALGGWQIVDQSGQVILEMKPWEHLASQPGVEDWLFRGTATPITVMVRREWYELVKGFDPSLSFAEDVDLWIRLTLAGCKSTWTQEAIATVLVHQNNSLRDYTKVRQGRMDFLNKIFSLPHIMQHLSMTQNAVLAKFLMNLAWLAASEGSPEQGMQDLVKATQTNPDLCADGGQLIRASLIDYSQFFLVNDPNLFANQVFRYLPPSLDFLQNYRRDVLAQVALAQAWRANANHDLPAAGKHMLAAVRYAPANLKNRGVVSIIFRSMLGTMMRPRNDPGKTIRTEPGAG